MKVCDVMVNIKNGISKFLNIRKDYDTFTTLSLFSNKLFNNNYNNLVKKILINENDNIIKKYSKLTYKNNVKYEDSPIWVCWWQGYEKMPQLVLWCYESIIDNCKNYNVNLITEKNYYEYVEIPEYILEKLNTGDISITHFSDILRVTLLNKYGGCWIDATIFVSSQIPDEVFTTPLYSIKNSESSFYNGEYISQERWSAFLLAGHKNCLLFMWLQDFLFNYWKNHNTLIDYFLIDYAIAIAVDQIPEIEKLITAIPVNNKQVHLLQKKLNDVFLEEEFKTICNETVFHKLSWKSKYIKFKVDKYTYFGKLFSY